MVELDLGSRDQAFRRGIEALQNEVYENALKEFRKAVACEDLRNLNDVDPLHLSYYGLLLAIVKRKYDVAEKLCRHAVVIAFDKPEVYLNLGKVYELARKPDMAIETYREGYRKHYANEDLLANLQTLSPRSRNVFPFLDRDHPLNKYGGLVVHKSKKIIHKST